MKRHIISLIAVILTLSASVFAGDPIDDLVTKLNSDKFGLWVNGISPILDLPQTAPTNSIIKKATQMVGFDKGRIESYKVIEIRKVELKAKPKCSAVLIQTNLGEKILLFNFEGNDWWTRFYDTPQKAKPNQRVDLTVKTPVELGKAQGTAGHP
ncbi:hypothetical protein P4E94_19715 [Pontiellaceae bacterium B12219]|nr:hypothetical protein [Pontiellaceae bacterium B12219]